MAKREIIMAAIVVIIFVLFLGWVGQYEALTTRRGAVISDNKIRDRQGKVWVYECDYPVGTEVKITIDNGHTDTVYSDDIIVEVEAIQ